VKPKKETIPPEDWGGRKEDFFMGGKHGAFFRGSEEARRVCRSVKQAARRESRGALFEGRRNRHRKNSLPYKKGKKDDAPK